jgi:D-alanyl-D-alanine dipeptidase
MVLYRTLRQIFLFSIVCTCLHAADTLPSDTAPVGIEAETEQALPILSESSNLRLILDLQARSLHRLQMLAGCRVAPLSEIEDRDALAFESNADSAPADVDGLMPEAAEALDTFREMVTSFGGTLELKSAYRPPAYQAHLHEVWVKWVKELRGNRTAGCQALREEVGAEFKRHQLLVKQQPVPVSDHTLGLAFDAAVAMPRGARLNRKRVTVDKVAALAGFRRPNSRRDPVHFTLLPQRLASGD